MSDVAIAPKSWQVIEQPKEPAKPFVTIQKWNDSPGEVTPYVRKTPETVTLLIAAFQNDFNVSEACDYAKIARKTYYQWLKEDPKFAEQMRVAQDFVKLAAKKRVQTIISSGSDRDAGPMARWLLEKRVPEIYGVVEGEKPNNTQNNFFILNNEQLSVLTKQSDIANSNPSELLEALEAQPVVDVRGQEASPA